VISFSPFTFLLAVPLGTFLERALIGFPLSIATLASSCSIPGLNRVG